MHTTVPWNALYTRTHFEEKAVSQLKKGRVVHYYPVTKILSGDYDKTRFVTRPLFPSIIFVQVQDDQQLGLLGKLRTFRNLVYWQNKPAVFSGLEIALMQDFIKTYLTVNATKFDLNNQHNT